MTHTTQYIISLVLIILISLRVPKESTGLEQNAMFGSSISIRKFLDRFIALLVFVYFGVAIQFNLESNLYNLNYF